MLIHIHMCVCMYVLTCAVDDSIHKNFTQSKEKNKKKGGTNCRPLPHLCYLLLLLKKKTQKPKRYLNMAEILF